MYNVIVTNKNNTPQEVWSAISNAKKPICIIDSRFDFDAFGSALSLHKILKQDGVDLKLIFANEKKDNYSEFFDLSSVEFEADIVNYDYSQFDLIIVFDSSSENHLTAGIVDFHLPQNITSINIDHHNTNTYFGDLNIVEMRSSTCVILFDILKANRVKIPQDAAEYLLLGILFDSGFLTFDKVSSSDFRTIGDLIDTGIDYFNFMLPLVSKETLDTMRFRGYVYSNFKKSEKFAYAYLSTLNSVYENLGIDRDKITDPAADLIRKLETVDMAFTVSEDKVEPNVYWVSFRARIPGVNVLYLAQNLKNGNGGGHKMAAGACVRNYDTIDEVVEMIRGFVEENWELIHQ